MFATASPLYSKIQAQCILTSSNCAAGIKHFHSGSRSFVCRKFVWGINRISSRSERTMRPPLWVPSVVLINSWRPKNTQNSATTLGDLLHRLPDTKFNSSANFPLFHSAESKRERLFTIKFLVTKTQISTAKYSRNRAVQYFSQTINMKLYYEKLRT